MAERTGPSKERRFWNTQPVPQTESIVKEISIAESGPIDPVKDPVKDISPDPLPLPAGFEWSTCDVNDAATMKEVYELLNGNYVEDDDAMFRFDYSVNFLRWALTPPGYHKDWHVGVRVTSNKKLVAFITGIPVDCKVYDKVMKMAEINFLCVHKKLREKRLAPVLIKEVTRRVNRLNIWQAVYTAGVVIPQPVSACRYWHRSLQPKKLIDIGFSHLKPKWTMAMTIRFYKTAEKTALPFRPMEKRDVPQMTKMLNDYLEKFGLRVHFSEEETEHWLLPREDVVECYVLEDASTKQITDFFSFYNLPSTVIGHPVHKNLKAAYSYYNICTKHSLKEVVGDALVIANKKGYDVFNALDLMENNTFLEDLKFGSGDGTLNYYVYNWKCPSMKPEQVGLVLL